VRVVKIFVKQNYFYVYMNQYKTTAQIICVPSFCNAKVSL